MSANMRSRILYAMVASWNETDCKIIIDTADEDLTYQTLVFCILSSIKNNTNNKIRIKKDGYNIHFLFKSEFCYVCVISTAECKESEYGLQLRIAQGFLQQLQTNYEEKTTVLDVEVDVEQPLELDKNWIKKLVDHHNIQNCVVIQIEDDYKDCIIALDNAIEGLLANKEKEPLQNVNEYQNMENIMLLNDTQAQFGIRKTLLWVMFALWIGSLLYMGLAYYLK